ncbi:MAG: hypothetical protein P1U56_09085 [Saprospiraceae bacterium]|nr:hypothetical protein [Saprospiraceae bacterium]
MLDNLDQHFVQSKLRYVSLLKSNQKLVDRPYDFNFIGALSEQQGKFNIIEPPLYKLYRYLLDLLNEKEDVDFITYESLFFELVPSISDEDKKILFTSGLDFINRQVNKGNDDFSSCGLKWYKYGLNNGLLVNNSKMNQLTFHTIVEYGCRENEMKWTNLFISSYRSFLDPEKEEEIVNKSLALIYIAQNEFDKALSILNHYTIHDIDQPKTRFNIIRSLFELFLINNEYYNLLLAKIHAFEVFISRNTFFNENVLMSYLNSIRLIRGLANRIVKKESRTKIKKWFVRHTDSDVDIVSLNWLSEKIKAY